MAQLSINPEGHHVRDGRTLAEIIADEEYLDPEESPMKTNDEKEEEKKFKFLSFELDMTYPRTLRGFVRVLQILLLLVSFICLVITTWGDSQGVYSFYCVVLVFAALISGFLFFTILADNRAGKICGLTWVKLELIYFLIFGFLVFLGACLAASNNSTGDPALNAGSAFGFIAFITFAVYLFWTWKEYKNPPDKDEDKKDDNEDQKEDEDADIEKGIDTPPSPERGNTGPRVGNGSHRRNSLIDPPQNINGDLRIDPPMHRDENNSSGKHIGHRFNNDGTKSLERQISVISHNELMDPKSKSDQYHRRHRSGSDNDSAYSEGSLNDRDRSLPTKMRRTASTRGEDRARASMKKPRPNNGERRINGSSERRPKQLSAAELMNQDGRQRKSVPNWLKAALEDDELEGPGRRLSSTMPVARRKNEYPLLHTSDEESVAYPSVSQTMGNRNPRWGPHHDGRGHREHTHVRRGANHIKHNRNHVGHGPHHRGGKRLHAHGHRQLHGHGKRHAHGQGRGHIRNVDRHGRMGPSHQRRQGHNHGRVRPHDDAMLRRMMENDLLVERKGYVAGPGETTTAKRVIHEQPTSIHFPERSRWDDNELTVPNGVVTNKMIERYFDSD